MLSDPWPTCSPSSNMLRFISVISRFLRDFGLSPILARNDFFFSLSGLSGIPKSPAKQQLGLDNASPGCYSINMTLT